MIDWTICSWHGAGDAALGHPRAQSLFDLLHALGRAFEAHRPAQLFGFAAGEAGRFHGHAENLLLEDRHAQGALQDRFEAGMRIGRPI